MTVSLTRNGFELGLMTVSVTQFRFTPNLFWFLVSCILTEPFAVAVEGALGQCRVVRRKPLEPYMQKSSATKGVRSMRTLGAHKYFYGRENINKPFWGYILLA